MQLPVVCWSLLGCALFIGPSLGVKRFPSPQDIAMLEHDIEEIFSQRKELDNNPITKDISVNEHEASSWKNELRLTKTVLQTFKTAAANLPQFGLSNGDVVGTLKKFLGGKDTNRQWQECSNISIPSCDSTSMYRTFDGRCNNLRQPLLGRALSCHRRILKADYEDGKSELKTYSNTQPNPRQVCRELHLEPTVCYQCNDLEISALFMSFGQFADHDLTLTLTETLPNNTPIPCCPNNPTNHEGCIQIPLGNDPDFPSSCMNVTRSIKCDQCVVEERQQRNSVTSFMDGSHIYGLTLDESNLLRSTNSDGKLNATILPGIGELLPQNVNATLPCGSTCFRSGDTRVNQNPLLTMLHTIWLRFHNIVAEQLSSINPNWNHEKVFQESRKFVIACFQHIFYEQYLPTLLDGYTVSYFGLDTKWTQYNSEQDPRTINEAMVAAFRLHSTVPDYFTCQHEDGNSEIIPFANNFFNVTPFYLGQLNCIAIGSFRQPQRAFDPVLVQSVTTFLYVRSSNTPPALDLCSINIQRGRDHGVPGYTAYVEFCFGESIRTFEDLYLSKRLHPECVNKYKVLYRNVRGIDLWSALQCEIRSPGAFLGPVAQCILGYQFHGTKYGDRFFYTHEGQRTSLTPSQKEAVMKVLLERIMCDTLNLNVIPENVFRYRSHLCRCDNYAMIPKLDLSLWGK